MVAMSDRWREATLGEYLSYFLKSYCEKRLARNTVNGYRTNIDKHIVPYIGSTRLFELDPVEVEALYDKLSEKGLSGTSVLYVHAVLRKALNTAVKRRILENNVLNYLDSPIKSRYHPKVLTAASVPVLLEYCKSRDIDIAVLLALSLRLCRGEVLGLKWCDIDWKLLTIEISRSATLYKQKFCISDTKSKNSNRTLLMSESLANVLRSFKRGLDDFIVYRPDGSQMTSSHLDGEFQLVLKSAGIPAMRFHDLRHPYVKTTTKIFYQILIFRFCDHNIYGSK